MPKYIISILLMVLPAFGTAQSRQELLALKNVDHADQRYNERHVSFVLPSGSKIKKYNPATLLFSSLLYFYQKVITVQISAGCTFHPSCSEFSKECIREFGLIKGVALSADRLSRCNRIAAFDIVESDMDMEKQKVNDSFEKYRWVKH